MRTPLLFGFLIPLVVAAGCSRDGTVEEARDAAADVRGLAQRAGERVADSWLTTKIQAQYFANDDIKARHVDVSTRDGVVTLSGFVNDDRTRQEAIAIATNTDGVRKVEDRLLIGRRPDELRDASARQTPTSADASAPGAVATSGAADANATNRATAVDDSGVVSLIQARYFLDPAIKARHIDVQANDAIVTLRGEVASEAERQQALLLARNTDGVKRVEDHLTVNAALAPEGAADASDHDAAAETQLPPPQSEPPAARPALPPPASAGSAAGSGDALAEAIRSKLAADRQLAGTSITVASTNGVVTLQGTVPNAAARQRALALARETSGATQVIDRLKVTR